MTFLQFLGFNRPKPKSTFGRYLRRGEKVFTGLGLIYLFLHMYPQILFAHSVEVEGITLFSRNELNQDDAKRCLSLTKDRITRAELYREGRKEKIFLCNSRFIFQFFRPGGSAFGYSFPVTENIIVASADLSTNTSRRFGKTYNTRSFSGLVAHEITHGMIRDHLGLLKGIRVPDWIAEGYCEYVAGDGSFPEAEGRALMVGGKVASSPSFRYYEFRKVMEYLITDKSIR